MRKTLPIFYSALLLTAVNLLLRFVSTSFQVYISAKIGAEGVGLLQLVMSVSGLGMVAGMAGIRTATMYLTAEELGKKQQQNVTWVLRGCFLYSILISGTLSVVIYYTAPFLAEHWIGNLQTTGAIRIFSKFLPMICLTGCMTGYFTAANKIVTLAAVEILEQFCYMGVTMATLILWAGNDAEKACDAVVLGSGISSCITLCILLCLRIRENAPKGIRIPVRARIMNAAIPLALADDLKSGISTAENLMVPKRLALYPGEASPLAAFGTVTGMVFPVLMFPSAILFALAELLIPELARCSAANSRRRIRYLVRRGLRVALLYGCVCGGILYLIAPRLCMTLYKSNDAGVYLRMYSILVPMLYCDAITDAMTKGLGQQKACVRYNIFTSAMDVALLFILLPHFGMRGYFISFLVTHAINFVLSLRRLIIITQITVPVYVPIAMFICAIFAALFAQFIPSCAVSIIGFLSIMLSLMVLLGIVSKRDLIWVKGLIIKK